MLVAPLKCEMPQDYESIYNMVVQLINRIGASLRVGACGEMS